MQLKWTLERDALVWDIYKKTFLQLKLTLERDALWWDIYEKTFLQMKLTLECDADGRLWCDINGTLLGAILSVTVFYGEV